MYKRKSNIFFLIIAVVAMIFLPSCAVYRRPAEPKRSEYHYREQETPQQALPRRVREPGEAGTIAQVVGKVNESVVGISTLHTQRDTFMEGNQTVEGVGSGFIVHSDGYIITNDHVVGNDARRITVILHNGDELKGQVLWTDPTLDLAMVKVNARDLPAMELGNSQELVVGETAVAIGTPLGLQFQHTVTAGIVSALNRTVQVPTGRGENFMEDLIQTDASINPGNSGGPLLNLEGQVVGINTVKVISAEGIGFAIPIDVAKPIIARFIKEGEFVTPYIGIVGFDKEIASYYKQNGDISEGVYVVNLDPRGPGYESGIRVDDIITQIGDQRVIKMLDLRRIIYSHRVGDSILITVVRGNRELKFEATLQESPVAT